MLTHNTPRNLGLYEILQVSEDNNERIKKILDAIQLYYIICSFLREANTVNKQVVSLGIVPPSRLQKGQISFTFDPNVTHHISVYQN